MLKLSSPAFTDGGAIPQKYTCEGEDISPPLAWSGVPAGAKSLVLIVDDPDAPDPKAPKMTWVHWVLYNLPADSSGLPEGVKPDTLPGKAIAGLTDWKRASYGGPCPPIGHGIATSTNSTRSMPRWPASSGPARRQSRPR